MSRFASFTNSNLSYIGSTKRYWEKRLEEHIHKSALTGKPLSGMQMFSPMHHVRVKCDHESPIMGRKDFKIIGREENPFLLQIKESIFIYKFRPKLNNNDACVPLHLFRHWEFFEFLSKFHKYFS